jgi:hypothetical protein
MAYHIKVSGSSESRENRGKVDLPHYSLSPSIASPSFEVIVPARGALHVHGFVFTLFLLRPPHGGLLSPTMSTSAIFLLGPSLPALNAIFFPKKFPTHSVVS